MASSHEPNNASDLDSSTEKATAISGPRFLFLRYLSGFLGLSVLALSLAVDYLGFGDPGELGSGQIILGLFGLGFLIAGVLGKRAKGLYIAPSILTLNTLIMLAGLELLAVVLVRSGILHSPQQNIVSSYRELPYYRNQAWTEQLWTEINQAESYAYEPYVIWRHREYSGELVTVDEQGRRVTPEADFGPDSFTLFTFGGSPMWGWGGP